MITLAQFADIVAGLPSPLDVDFDDGMRFELVGSGVSTNVLLGGRVAGPLPMYQVRSATKSMNVDIRGASRLLEMSKFDGTKADEARGRLMSMLSNLNQAISTAKMSERGFVLRTYGDTVGGVVSRQFLPLDHTKLIAEMMATPGLEGATVHRWATSPAEIEFTMLTSGEWEVDGGLKAGMIVGNGQFGNRSTSLTAMLFRLLCKNGMMGVEHSSELSRRHAGRGQSIIDIARMTAEANSMFEQAKRAMFDEVDVVWALVELYRRKFIARGVLRKALARMDEVHDGVLTLGYSTTVWGLAQSLTAAARDYGFVQMRELGQLAGSLVAVGMQPVLRVEPSGGEDWQKILDEMGRTTR